MAAEDRIPHLALRARWIGARLKGVKHTEYATLGYFKNGADAILPVRACNVVTATLGDAIEVSFGVNNQTKWKRPVTGPVESVEYAEFAVSRHFIDGAATWFGVTEARSDAREVPAKVAGAVSVSLGVENKASLGLHSIVSVEDMKHG